MLAELRFLFLSVALLFALVTQPAAQSSDASEQQKLIIETMESGKGKYSPGEILVQYRRDVDATAEARAMSFTRVVSAQVIHEQGGKRLVLYRLRPTENLINVIQQLSKSRDIEFVEPNWIYKTGATSNDPYFVGGRLWGMYGDKTSPPNAFGSQASEAWAAGFQECGDVWVGIIDTGYMYNHADLAANAGTNPGEIAGNGIDDDGNGFLDDLYGWDFVHSANTVFDGDSDEHGTHVAGTIGTVGGNSQGVAGVCWEVKLFSAKFVGPGGSGTTANALRAIDYLTDLKRRHKLNLVATNNGTQASFIPA